MDRPRSRSTTGRMSEQQMIQCRKHFWNSKQKRRQGRLSWGEFTKMCSVVELHVSNTVMNQLFAIADRQKQGCISFPDFVTTFFQKRTKSNIVESVRELSANTLSEIRRHFFNKEEKRYGKLLRVEFVEMICAVGIEMTYEDYDKIFHLAEASKEGKISFEDFICMFLRGTPGGDRKTAELAIIQRCFTQADVEKKGSLNRTQFRHLLKSVGIDLDARQLTNIFRYADQDKNGSISFEEFREMFLKSKCSFRCGNEMEKGDQIKMSSLTIPQMIETRNYFARFDINRDGRLSWREFNELVQNSNLRQSTIRKAYSITKQNRDNSISFKEFFHIFSSVDEMKESLVLKKKKGMEVKEKHCNEDKRADEPVVLAVRFNVE